MLVNLASTTEKSQILQVTIKELSHLLIESMQICGDLVGKSTESQGFEVLSGSYG
jgi:hypothetical protein